MAGGEGTRLRPLTSNQPKPMVPIVGQALHGAHHRPAAAPRDRRDRGHGGLPAAGDPRLLRRRRVDGRDAALLGRGDAARHRGQRQARRGAAGRDVPRDLRRRALRLRPDRDRGGAQGRRRGGDAGASSRSRTRSSSASSSSTRTAASSGSWRSRRGARCSRTRSTPASTCWSRRCCGTCPTASRTTSPSSSSRTCCRAASRCTATSLEGYWQDIGNLEQYRQANFDALDGRIELDLPGIRLRDNVYLGDGVQLPELGQIEGPAFIGNYCQDRGRARGSAPYSVLGQNVVVKEGAPIERSVIDSGCYIGRSARIEGAILGKGVDVRAHARPQRGRGGRRRVLDRRGGGARRRTSRCTRSRRSRPAPRSTPT